MRTPLLSRSPLLGFLILVTLTALPRAVAGQRTPEGRAHHQVVYHAGEGRVYLLGGSTRRDEGYHYFDDAWSWDGDGWARVGTLPFPRSSQRVVYHAGRGSLVLFGGGSEATHAADGRLWEWSRKGWTVLAGSSSGGRAEPGMCYDSNRDRVVVFGGWDGSNSYSGVTLELDGDALAEVETTGPSARAGHAFVYDPVRRRCLLFAGRGDDGYLGDTWEWDGAEWRRIEAPGPSPRWFFGAATDHANGRIVIFGGAGPEGELGDTWVWDGGRWELLTRDGPPARAVAKLAFDGSEVILFGGRARTSGGFVDLADTWALRGRTWTSVGATDPDSGQGDTGASRADSRQKEGVVSRKASGTFEVELNPQPMAHADAGGSLSRLAIEKRLHGDLEGTSRGEMLAARTDVDGSAGYVAIERVTGTLHGRSGSFVLQHSGTMTRGAQELSITVVPDSGSGELAGLAGRMTIRIEDGTHYYELVYTLPDDR